MGTRSFAFVIKEDSILMVRQRMENRAFFFLPGGDVLDGESPEDTAKRELFETCNISGEVKSLLTVNYKLSGLKEYVFFVECDNLDEPKKMKNFSFEGQNILNVQFVKFDLLSERDKAYLYSCGILEVPGFREKLFQKL